MPLLKKVVKLDPREAIIKWTGTGTDTLTLASLASTGQTLTGTVVPAAHIIDSDSSVNSAGECIITRNSEVALQVSGNYKLKSAGSFDAVLNENSTSSILVNLTTNGTLILKVRKTQGYSDVIPA